MKKIILLTMVAFGFLFVQHANAQSVGKEMLNRNEISLSYGFAANSDIINFYAEAVSVMLGGEIKHKNAVGPLSLEYFRRVSPVVAVGGIGVISSYNNDIMIHGSKTDSYKSTYFTIMPAVKFNWLRNESFGMYSKFGVGVTFASLSLKDVDPTVAKEKSKDAMFNFQASLIGIEAGGTFRGFAELGFGEQGILLVGVRYNF